MQLFEHLSFTAHTQADELHRRADSASSFNVPLETLIDIYFANALTELCTLIETGS